jgi:NTP pyrophosphatase (non-canonical NTP hydrolase)
MQKSKITVEDLLDFSKQEHSRLISHYKIERSKVRYTMFAKLVEEVGEFSEALLTSDSYQRKSKLKNNETHIDEELADIILISFLLSQELDIDLPKALKDKIERIKKRKY